jgi:hypothetical protein
MGRYYFHLQNGSFAQDTEGTDLAPDDVRSQAIAAARSLLSEGMVLGFDRTDWVVSVVDAAGARVLDLRFSEALDKEH